MAQSLGILLQFGAFSRQGVDLEIAPRLVMTFNGWTCSLLASAGTVLYVSDSGIDRAVHLVNGSGVSAGDLTVVPDLPIYIQGNYETVNKKPSAVLADAITVLANTWGRNWG